MIGPTVRVRKIGDNVLLDLGLTRFLKGITQ
jgi:hypothetical protein